VPSIELVHPSSPRLAEVKELQANKPRGGLLTTHAEPPETRMTLNFRQVEEVSLMAARSM
jgi:hypothetical protein